MIIDLTDPDNIVIPVGADYDDDFVWKDPDGAPVDLTGYKAYMQIRARFKSEDEIFDLSTEGEDPAITIVAAEGRVKVHIGWEQTGQITNRKGVYDILLVGPTGRTRLIQGEVEFDPRVTVVP